MRLQTSLLLLKFSTSFHHLQILIGSYFLEVFDWIFWDGFAERSARSTFPDLINFRVAKLNGFRRVFAHVAPIFFERGIAKPETKVLFSVFLLGKNIFFFLLIWSYYLVKKLIHELYSKDVIQLQEDSFTVYFYGISRWHCCTNTTTCSRFRVWRVLGHFYSFRKLKYFLGNSQTFLLIFLDSLYDCK